MTFSELLIEFTSFIREKILSGHIIWCPNRIIISVSQSLQSPRPALHRCHLPDAPWTGNLTSLPSSIPAQAVPLQMIMCRLRTAPLQHKRHIAPKHYCQMISWFNLEGRRFRGALSAIMPEEDFGVACDDLSLAVDNDMTVWALLPRIFLMAK